MSTRDRLAAELRRRILSGDYAPGQRLPPLWQLAKEFGATEPVAQNAVGDLRRAGLLRTVPGMGTWVVDDITGPVYMQSALDELRAGADAPWAVWSADALGPDGVPELVSFPAAWIQRLLDDRAALAARLGERGGRMSGTR